MHMIPQQVFNAALMGLVLGTLAVRSNSLVPCIVFHFLNNGLGVLHGRFGVEWYETALPTILFTVEDGVLHYRWPTLVVCFALAAPLLTWLFRPLYAGSVRDGREPPSGGSVKALPLLNAAGRE